MLAEHQPRTVYCGYCSAQAVYDTDNGRIVTDWDISGVQDPCDPQCHVPEEFLPDDLDAFIDKLVHSINRRTKLINDIDTMQYTPRITTPRSEISGR